MHVFALLAGMFADRTDNRCRPKRATVAKLLHCSLDTVDRALSELVRIGALEIHERTNDMGYRVASEYRLLFARPMGIGADADAAPVRQQEPESREPDPPALISSATIQVTCHRADPTASLLRLRYMPATRRLVGDHHSSRSGTRKSAISFALGRRCEAMIGAASRGRSPSWTICKQGRPLFGRSSPGAVRTSRALTHTIGFRMSPSH